MEALAVTVPVTDLRKEPVKASGGYAHDDLQESQLLLNESLVLVGEKEGWFRVEAVEQPKYEKGRGWQGYPGWVQKRHVGQAAQSGDLTSVVQTQSGELLDRPSLEGRRLISLPLATRVRVVEKEAHFLKVRLATGTSGWIAGECVATNDRSSGSAEDLEKWARLFRGTPYLWGGRSIFLPPLARTATGVDCSGLTQLVYRLKGRDIPRNAHDQWRAAGAVPPGGLEKGDLIFLSKADALETITHVMLSLGGERFIEAAETGLPVRESSFAEKLGVDMAGLWKEGFIAAGRKVYFGRPNPEGQFRAMSNE